MNAAIGLMQPENAEATSSSLLTLLAPLASPEGIRLPLATDALLAAYFLRGEQLSAWADAVVAALPQYGLKQVDVIKAISKRQKLVTALESYLMANRGAERFEELTPRVRLLAQSTLAHALADEGSKAALCRLFELAAAHIEQVLPDPSRQATYAKTLLGVLDAARVEAWVNPRVVRVQEMRRKWGSCSSAGTVTLATDLLDQDEPFQDYVIVHELLHLRYANHGRMFKALMSAHVPGWQEMENQQRAHGTT